MEDQVQEGQGAEGNRNGALRKAMKRRAKELATTAGHNWALMSAGDKKFFKRQARQEMRAANQTPTEAVSAE